MSIPVLQQHYKEKVVPALTKKLGQVRNLPVYWDEIDEKEKMDKVRKSLGVFTEGAQGGKLNSDRTNKEKDEMGAGPDPPHKIVT